MKWLQRWRQRRIERWYRSGYEWAAGAILSGELPALQVAEIAIWEDPFDYGAQAAASDLLRLGVGL